MILVFDTCIVWIYLWFIPFLSFCNRYLAAFRRASSAMSGLETSQKQADDDFADNPEEEEEVYKFLDAVSLSGWGPSQV